MKDITFYNDKSRTETTILFNKHDDVIGLTVYFESPKQLSDFWNVNTNFQKQSHPSIKQPISRGPSIPINAQMFTNRSPDMGPQVRTSISKPKSRPCGGPNQRPCR